MRYLVVDDEVSICRGTAQRLRQIKGIAADVVDCAFSGEEATQRLMADDYDVLITDIRMNGMDGLTLIEEAKRLRPTLAAIVVSAFDQFEYAKRGIRLGVHDFWVKPYTLQQMETSLTELVCQLAKARQQENRQLDIRLSEAIAVSGMPLTEVLGQQAADLGCLLLVAGRQPFTLPHQAVGVWVYQPVNRPYLVLGYSSESALHQYLQQLTECSGQSAGVSLPVGDAAVQFGQASFALDCDWVYSINTAYYHTPDDPSSPNLQRTCSRLLKQAMVDSPAAVLTELSRIESVMSQPHFICFIKELYAGLARQIEEWLPAANTNVAWERERPQPHTGWQSAIAQLLDELRNTKRYHLDRSKSDPIQWAKAYVGQHLHEQVDMAVVANELNLSYPYFSKLFSEQVGMPFSQYLLELRMKEACRLLLVGERVTAISQRVGYQNVNNFIRAFKKHYGVSPTAFRRND